MPNEEVQAWFQQFSELYVNLFYSFSFIDFESQDEPFRSSIHLHPLFGLNHLTEVHSTVPIKIYNVDL